MSIYYTLAIFLIGGSIAFEAYAGRQLPLSLYRNWRYVGEKVFYIVCCVIMISIVALRADFWTDSFGYSRIFYTVKDINFLELLTNSRRLRLTNGNEMMFLVLTKIITLFTNDPHIEYVIISLITYLPIVIVVYKKSNAPFLSLLTLYEFGFFFSSFNVIRSCMVFGLSCLFLDDIIKKNVKRYIISVLLLSLFHTSALLLIPIYFVLQIPLLDRKHVLITMTFVFLFSIGFDKVLSVFDRFFYGSFYTSGEYSGINTTGGSVGMIFPYLLVFALLLAFGSFVNTKEKETQILLNGTMIWCTLGFSVLLMRIMTRMTDMMFIYPMLFVPKLLNNITPRNPYHRILQRILIFGMFYLFILWRLYVSLKDSPFNPYMTFF